MLRASIAHSLPLLQLSTTTILDSSNDSCNHFYYFGGTSSSGENSPRPDTSFSEVVSSKLCCGRPYRAVCDFFLWRMHSCRGNFWNALHSRVFDKCNFCYVAHRQASKEQGQENFCRRFPSARSCTNSSMGAVCGGRGPCRVVAFTPFWRRECIGCTCDMVLFRLADRKENTFVCRLIERLTDRRKI